MDDLNSNYYLYIMKNIVKKNGEYTLETVYEKDKDERMRETEDNKNNLNSNELTKNCYCCIHSSGDCCILLSSLMNMPENTFTYHSYINKCDAYYPIYPLNIAKSKEDMIEFIIKVENFFSCPEDYESYFGFNRNWDKDTGDILETVEEYYMRGGEFENIPDQYPCVINFPVVDSMLYGSAIK